MYSIPKYDFNDITIIPCALSAVESRSEINCHRSDGLLPLFSAPMDTVVNMDNAELFHNLGINVCLPRNGNYTEYDDRYFYSFGLKEIITMLDEKVENPEKVLPKKILIDVANGHMQLLLKTAKRIKSELKVELMVGNIANPETYSLYCDAGVDWIRVGIGAGSVCTTSANAAVHYPMASLIRECYMESTKRTGFRSKIVADGGFTNYADIIKALGLGADAVMIGKLFNQTLESVSQCFKYADSSCPISKEYAMTLLKQGTDVYKLYRGMSTKDVQRSWNKNKIVTSEGVVRYNKIEYTLESWIENFIDYLKSNMSYCGFRSLCEFKGNAQYVFITEQAFKRFYK